MNRLLGRYVFQIIMVSYCLSGFAQNNDSISKFNKVQQLQEVVVTSRSAKERVNNVQIGQEKIKISDLTKQPSLLGEHDVFKSLQLLPGIKSESEASSGFQVRGGKSSQNLVLLDNASIYQAGHLMGLFSSFNDDALVNASLYKGLIPAQYGDATSSVLDVMTKSGDMNQYHYGGTLGLLSAKASIEGPIVKDKASFLFTARRSYADLFLKTTDKYKDCSLYFYDMNGRIDWKLNDANRFSVTFFHGKDVMLLNDFSDINWENTSLTLRMMHYYSNKLLSNTNLYFSSYYSYMNMSGLGMDYDQNGFIRHYGLNHNFQFFPTSNLSFNFGLQSALIDLCSAEWNIGTTNQKEERKAWENSLWVNGVWTPISRLSLSAGLRLNSFSVLGGSPYYTIDNSGNITSTANPSAVDFVKTYVSLEPRFSANWKIDKNQNIKLGYTQSSQNIHAISSNTTMPFDRYTMSSNIIKPELSNQISLGYSSLLLHGDYDYSVEGYYKNVNNVYDYRDGKSFRSEIEMEKLLLGGKSRAYGVEIAAHKNTGRLTGWLSYTLSWVENKIDGINNNNWYTANNDRRHDISIVCMYKLNDNWDLNACWKFNTGQALTAPSAKYQIDNRYYYYYNERNGYRAPCYNRLDIGANYTIKKQKYTSQWSFGIYNLYNRRNPYMMGFENDSSLPSGIQAYKLSLFGIIPSISYNIKF